MSDHISVSFFPVNNPEGSLLKEKVRSLIENELNLKLQVYEVATQKDFFYSCVQDDIVIFDASIEVGNNYAIATAQPTVMDHVLIVSRTYLPLNFFGLREGGAPDYPISISNKNIVEYKKPNTDIIEWLRKQVLDLKRLSPRPQKEKKVFGSLKTMGKSIDLQEERKKSEQIFISYRSKYYNEVNSLKSRIEKGKYHNDNEKKVYFLLPGKLVYEDEVLTEQRCWQLVSVIDRIICASEEFWIYKTKDYLDSWWTRAELMSLSYNGFSTPKIRIYDPTNDIVYDADENYLPKMTKEQKKRLSRWYSNCDPATMGPESLDAMRKYSKLPFVGRIKYFSDYVWSKEFWANNLVPCIECRNKSEFPDMFDIDTFLWIGSSQESHEPLIILPQKDKFSFIRLTSDQLKESLEQNRFVCPYCKSVFSVDKGEYPRYLWLPTRHQRAPVNVFEAGSSEFSNLAKLTVYRVHSVEN